MKKTPLIIGGCVLAGIIFLLVSCIGYYNSVQGTGIDKESAITAQNNNNTIVLNQYVAGLYESVGVANLKSQQMDKILTDAVKGRYTTGSTANPNDKGSLFSAIKEAYPNLDLKVYDKIVDYIMAKRDEYAALSGKLQDQVRDFVKWRKSGFPHAMFVSWMGFPDNTLRCSNDQGQVLFGTTCEDYLLTVSQPNGSNNGAGQGAVNIPGLAVPPAKQ